MRSDFGPLLNVKQVGSPWFGATGGDRQLESAVEFWAAWNFRTWQLEAEREASIRSDGFQWNLNAEPWFPAWWSWSQASVQHQLELERSGLRRDDFVARFPTVAVKVLMIEVSTLDISSGPSPDRWAPNWFLLLVILLLGEGKGFSILTLMDGSTVVFLWGWRVKCFVFIKIDRSSNISVIIPFWTKRVLVSIVILQP